MLGPDHSATKALAKASITMAAVDLWHARLAVKTLRRDQREAIAEAVTKFALITFVLAIALANSGALADGFGDFVRMSNAGPVEENTCATYGGRQIFGARYDAVLRDGNHSQRYQNVIHYKGRRYIVFGIETTGLVGKLLRIKKYSIGVCEF